ncbi:MAG: hypothetical protein ACLFQ7_08595 [Phormidium sp.]
MVIFDSIAVVHIPPEEKQGQLRCIASPGDHKGSVMLYQDAYIYATILEPGDSVTHSLANDRGVWIQVARGGVQVQEQTLNAGDAIALWDTPDLQVNYRTRSSKITASASYPKKRLQVKTFWSYLLAIGFTPRPAGQKHGKQSNA